jgi:hypothetical protein
MKTKIKEYHIVPSIACVLHDRISLYRAVSDEAKESDNQTLEAYFNDIYHLFLNKLVRITHQAELSYPETKKLKVLLDELIRIKALLEKSEY